MDQHFNIVNLFIEQAQKQPDQIAIIEKGESISFGSLLSKVEKTAAYFQSKGIKKGDRIMVFVPMGMNLYRIVLALFRVGATAVFLDEWVSVKRMEECCRVANCKGFVSVLKGKLLSLISSELRKIPVKLSLKERANSQQFQEVETSLSDTALITFTTGSSGTPKAAKRTHGFLREQFKVLSKKIDPAKSSVDMPVLPIVLLINLGMGITSVIADFKSSKPDSLKPDKILRQLKKYSVSSISSSPYFIHALSQHLIRNYQDFQTIKRIFTGGAPVFPKEAMQYQKAFPQAHVEILYGSTEAEPISSIVARDLSGRKVTEDKGLYVGKVESAATVKIIDITNDEINIDSEADLEILEMAAGSIGEIIVSGNHVLSEYFNNEKALARNKIFIDGICWHRTGDSGFIKSGNLLFLTGPCQQLIRETGEIISPFLYEYHFSCIAGVTIGTFLNLKGRNTAVVQLSEGVDKDEIATELRAFPLVEEIIFVKKIPRDPRHHSKIDYNKLKSTLN